MNIRDTLERAKDYFRQNIAQAHIDGALSRASRLSEYNLHPFLYKYIANFLTGNGSSESIARALIYPRVLGTSITTIFGMKAQNMLNVLFDGYGSAISGIDIEFIDALDGRRKYCQVKSGPNTINKDDVETIVNHFRGIKNLARTNSAQINYNDLIVGVLYGNKEDLSGHYLKIEENHYPVYIGVDFWHRLTGEETFYNQLIEAFGEVALEIDGRDKLEGVVKSLAKEIEEAELL